MFRIHKKNYFFSPRQSILVVDYEGVLTFLIKRLLSILEKFPSLWEKVDDIRKFIDKPNNVSLSGINSFAFHELISIHFKN